MRRTDPKHQESCRCRQQLENKNDLESKNISTLAMEVRVSCRVAGTPGAAGTDPVIGACPTASLRQGRLLEGFQPPGTHRVERSADASTQVSSLGMPLVNELFIGLDDKNRFKASRPRNNSTFANYVTNPVLQAVLMAVESSLSFLLGRGIRWC